MKIDQWLWAAGFYDNRGLAQAAADAGKVTVGGERVKAVHEIKPGDRLEIAMGEYLLEIAVLALEVQQSAYGESMLYEESEDSIARRAQAMEAKKLAASQRRHIEPVQHHGQQHGRPGGGGGAARPGRRGKNQRRQWEGFKRGR